MKTPLFRLSWLLALWGGAVAAAAAADLPRRLAPAGVPLLAAVLTAGSILLSLRAAWARRAWAAVPLRGLLAVHLVRFVGAYFLWLAAQGRLPRLFAERAGWGDIAAAAGALLLLAAPEGALFRRALALWSAVGVADLLLAVGTGGWLNRVHPGSMAEIAGFPLALVPLFAVPVLFTTHVVIARRLLGRGRSADLAGARPEAA
ncbi:MAG TPA: hypothetical protein VHC86_14520 [Opitutaceae bacterium]|nr:hypothetical protein [Opitutaceae bacterium]